MTDSTSACCGPQCCGETATTEDPSIRAKVRDGYAKIADDPGREVLSSCCPPAAGVSERLGYDAAELAVLPEGADMGLSCGNPAALASLGPGETVVDLGSGGGFDVFIAGPKVGAEGRAIGIDMTHEMLAKARRGIATYQEHHGLDNVEFRLGEIEHLPVADGTADVVLSNCVINLSPEQPRVWREIGRVLKPGGRVAVSDIILLRPLPEAVTSMVESWVGCISGASLIDDVRAMASAAGLVDVRIEERPSYVKALEQMGGALFERITAHLPEGSTIGDYIASADISARKP